MSIDWRMSSIQTLTWPKYFPNRNAKSTGKILARSVVFEPITWLASFTNYSIVYATIYETKDKMLAARGCRSLFKIKERLCRIMESNKGGFWSVEAGLVFKWLILTKNVHFGLLRMDKYFFLPAWKCELSFYCTINCSVFSATHRLNPDASIVQ